MGLVVPDVGEPLLLEGIRDLLNAAGCHLHLYKNNYTPIDASVLGSFTEADFSGYAATVAVFTVPAEIANKASMSDVLTRLFTHNGGGTANTVYGYYVTYDTGPDLIWAERFSAPITMTSNGDQISILLNFTLDSENH